MDKARQSRVKIYISCHKDCAAVHNDVFTPVRQKDIVRFLQNGTEEDKFMAARANEYCELLTQYWAWKYGDADYYGFCQYRRYFEFNDKVRTNAHRSVRREYLNARTAEELGLNDADKLCREISRYDVIAPQPFNYYICTVYWQYKNADHLHIEDLDAVMEIIRTEYPDYERDAKDYLYGHYLYTCNMFVMRRALFEEYSAWLFAILRRFYQRRDMAALRYSGEAMRAPGHLGERLFGIYLTHLARQKRYEIGKRRIVLFGNTEPPFRASPAFGGDAVALFVPVSADTLAYAAVCLRSVADAASFDRRYDAVLLCSGVGEADKEKLRDVLHGRANFSLRFFDVDCLLDERMLSDLPAESRTAYMQLALPYLFAQYRRAVWLDAEIVALQDIAALYDCNLDEEDCCAAAADVCFAGGLNGYSPALREEYAAAVEKGVYAFAEPGVLVMNCAAMRAAYTEDALLHYVRDGVPGSAERRDLLNLLCCGRIRFLEYGWNFIPEREGEPRALACAFAPKEMYAAYRAAAASPMLVHFAGSEKPWAEADSRYAHLFWRICRETPYAEVLLLSAGLGDVASADGFWMRLLFPRGSRRRALLKKLGRRFRKI